MPRITTINSGAFSFSSSVLSLQKENLEEFYDLTSNVSVIDEGESVEFSLQYRNIDTIKTIYWEILPGANVTYEDFSTLMNGTFQIANSDIEKVTITAAKDFTNIDEEITENFSIRFRENNDSGTIITTSSEIDILDTSYLAVGQQEFTTPGTYTFIVPERVNKISFVLIGGGGGQFSNFTNSQNGASGGALAYCNNLFVEEGQDITIVVGDRGLTDSSPTDGGNSSIIIDSNKIINAEGGKKSPGGGAAPNGGVGTADSYYSSNGASCVLRTGGAGGNRGFGPGGTVFENGGAGSAAGYSSNGVKGGNGGLSGNAGLGGSGGSAAGDYLGSGGGTGIYGEGSSGIQGIKNSTVSRAVRSGKAGSKATSTEVYSQYGGASAGGTFIGSHVAGTGAVRIIWPGQLRQYPTTRTSDETPIP